VKTPQLGKNARTLVNHALYKVLQVFLVNQVDVERLFTLIKDVTERVGLKDLSPENQRFAISRNIIPLREYQLHHCQFDFVTEVTVKQGRNEKVEFRKDKCLPTKVAKSILFTKAENNLLNEISSQLDAMLSPLNQYTWTQAVLNGGYVLISQYVHRAYSIRNLFNHAIDQATTERLLLLRTNLPAGKRQNHRKRDIKKDVVCAYMVTKSSGGLPVDSFDTFKKLNAALEREAARTSALTVIHSEIPQRPSGNIYDIDEEIIEGIIPDGEVVESQKTTIFPKLVPLSQDELKKKYTENVCDGESQILTERELDTARTFYNESKKSDYIGRIHQNWEVLGKPLPEPTRGE